MVPALGMAMHLPTAGNTGSQHAIVKTPAVREILQNAPEYLLNEPFGR
jgi:hypothetical protein